MNTQRNTMKTMEPQEYRIGENTFYVYPFAAFKAANLSGDIIAFMMPIAASLAPVLGKGQEGQTDLMDMDINEAAPHLAGALASFSGDRVEGLMRKLLMGNNVVVQKPGGEAEWLTEDTANELFCANMQDMFVLAYYVIKTNYGSFFGKAGSPFGAASSLLNGKWFPGTAPLT